MTKVTKRITSRDAIETWAGVKFGRQDDEMRQRLTLKDDIDKLPDRADIEKRRD
jgi:hypothetical protein